MEIKLPQAIETAAEAAIRDNDNGFDLSNDVECFLSGVRWLFTHLAAQAPEFSPREAIAAWRATSGESGTRLENFTGGARWMHEQLAAQLAAVTADRSALKADRAMQTQEIARLRVALAEAHSPTKF